MSAPLARTMAAHCLTACRASGGGAWHVLTEASATATRCARRHALAGDTRLASAFTEAAALLAARGARLPAWVRPCSCGDCPPPAPGVSSQAGLATFWPGSLGVTKLSPQADTAGGGL